MAIADPAGLETEASLASLYHPFITNSQTPMEGTVAGALG